MHGSDLDLPPPEPPCDVREKAVITLHARQGCPTADLYPKQTFY